MEVDRELSIYEMSINLRVAWQAHSLSNAGSDGSIRTLPRRQLLAGGVETDACSGNILKRYHAMLLAEYFEANGIPLCTACAERDGRRVLALVAQPDFAEMTIESVLARCGLCDTHGFLVPAKKAAADGSTAARRCISKHSLLEFSFALALPECQAVSAHLFTRRGGFKEGGQMLIKKSARSGEYALCIRYKSVGVGVDTDKWNVVVDNEAERRGRHRAVLSALRDQILSPEGALTSTMMPHLTGLRGALVIKRRVGRAPVYSPLEADFTSRLAALAGETCEVCLFETMDEFNTQMNRLIASSVPALPLASKTKVRELPDSAAGPT